MKGNGQKTRIRAQSVDTRDARQYCFAVLENGGVLLADQHYHEADGNETIWTTIWDDVLPGTTIIRITRFTEGGGYWQPLELGEQTEAQVVAVEKILNIHGLALISEVSLMGTGRRAP